MREIIAAGIYNGIIGSIGATSLIVIVAVVRTKLGV